MGTLIVNQYLSKLWTPAEITTDFWYDFSDSSSVTLSGSNITEITNKGGIGGSAVQTDANLQPLFEANGLNNMGVMAPDGVTDRLVQTTALTYDPQLVFGVFVAKSLNAGAFVKIQGNETKGVGVGQGGSNFDNDGAKLVALRENITWVVSSYSLTIDSGAIVSYAYNSFVGLDGFSESTSGVINTPTNTEVSIGGYKIFGINRYTDAYTAELLIFDNLLDSTLRQKLEGYLAHKWGLTANLPAEHPYKNTPPYA